MIKILDTRKEKHLTQEELAFLANVDRSALSLYETGKKTPKLATLEKIAKALGVGVAELL